MVVLQINTLGATLSTGRTTRELHEWLLSKGHKSYIVCPRKEDCDDVFSFTTINLIHLDVLQSLVSGVEGIHSTAPTLKLVDYIKHINPDIVHLRVLHCNSINFKVFLRYLAENNIATVITMHDFWYMTGQCCYFTVNNCYKWKTGCGKCKFLQLSGRKPLFDRTKYMWSYKKYYFSRIPRLAVIGVSDWVVEQIKDSFLSTAPIVKRIYNWIDLNKFHPKETEELRKRLGLNDKRIILGVSASWTLHNRKGFDVYLELASIIPERYRILLIGNLRSDCTIPDNITIIPPINDASVLADYYSMADVYLNLSVEETFGKVSAEALACGTPIVAYDSTANKELVPPKGGIIIKTLDIETILNAVDGVLSWPKEKTKEICTSFAKENFNKEKNIREQFAVYEQLVKMRERSC